MCITNLSLSNLSPTNLAVSNLSLSNSSLSNLSPANVHIFILSLSNLLYQSNQAKPVGGNFQEVGKRYRKRKAYRNEARAACFNCLAILFPWHLLLLETFSVDASPPGTFLLSAAPLDSSEARGPFVLLASGSLDKSWNILSFVSLSLDILFWDFFSVKIDFFSTLCLDPHFPWDLSEAIRLRSASNGLQITLALHQPPQQSRALLL